MPDEQASIDYGPDALRSCELLESMIAAGYRVVSVLSQLQRWGNAAEHLEPPSEDDLLTSWWSLLRAFDQLDSALVARVDGRRLQSLLGEYFRYECSYVGSYHGWCTADALRQAAHDVLTCFQRQVDAADLSEGTMIRPNPQLAGLLKSRWPRLQVQLRRALESLPSEEEQYDLDDVALARYALCPLPDCKAGCLHLEHESTVIAMNWRRRPRDLQEILSELTVTSKAALVQLQEHPGTTAEELVQFIVNARGKASRPNLITQLTICRILGLVTSSRTHGYNLTPLGIKVVEHVKATVS